MKKMKKTLAIALSLVLLITILPVINSRGIARAEATFAITSPADNALVAAGHFDIKWSTASGTVTEYEVYLDDELQGTTKNTVYECYSTEVVVHTVYVVAKMGDGSKQTSGKVYFGISKKGLGLATDMGRNISLKDMGCSWYYNWGTGPSSGQQYNGIEYVPMVWKETDANKFKNKVNGFINQGYKYVLAFNEPDLKDQCNMPVDDVYNVWQGIDDVTGIYVSSPVTALWLKASPGWFQTFMEKIDSNNDHDVDFISIHCYPDNFGGAGMADWFLKEVIDWTWDTYQKPIWITEFSTTGSNITSTGGNGTKEFWERVMPGLDARPYVERYAAFNFNDDRRGLWLYDTGALTPAGEIYRDYGNPEGYEQGPTIEPDYKTDFSTRKELLTDNATIDKVLYEDYINQPGVTATASSKNNNNSDADKTIDSDIGSRWESKQGIDPQTLTIDLGQVRNIKQVGIVWESASAKTYTIDVSTDGNTWTTVALIEDGKSTQNRLDTTTFKAMVQGRYVRINGTERTTNYGYSIYDVAIYGRDDAKVDETTTIEQQPTTTQQPTTQQPTTPKPTATTAAPTTQQPTTPKPTTAAPTTQQPTTPKPTTAAPTTAVPTTQQPTTPKPTTAAPTTQQPTTPKPTTAAPTTQQPTTPKPTTAAPTTQQPTTPKQTENDTTTSVAIDNETTTESQEIQTTSKTQDNVTETSTISVTNRNESTTGVVSKPAKAKIISAKNLRKRKAKIKLKKLKNVSGYQVMYSTKKKFNKKATKVKNTKKIKLTLKSLKKNKKYYIKVRAYKQQGKAKYYGKWSRVKRIKIKK